MKTTSTTVAAAFVIAASLFAGSCSEPEGDGNVRAFRVTSRSQLIGGPTALGDIGDFMLENDQVRLLVQDKTYNRGAGVFGGSLIDADLVRATNNGTVLGGSGNDSFGEMFPAFFLEMINPENVEVINDGSDGNAAIVEVSGRGGEFVTMLRYLNQLLVGTYKDPSTVVQDVVAGRPPDSDAAPNLRFSTRYILEPGARHVRIESTMRNISPRTLQFPPQEILAALAGLAGLDLGDFRLPMGHVLGFGKLSKIFLPGLGYDINLGLREASATPVDLPAFPGFITPVVASTNSHGVNYGFANVNDPETNFVYQRDQDAEAYGGRANPDDMLYLFNASGFGGVFSSQAPKRLAPSHCEEGADKRTVCENTFPEDQVQQCVAQWETCLADREEIASSYTYTNYFIIGDGDVASIMEELYRIRGAETYPVRGRVVDAVTGSGAGEKESVLIYEGGSGCKEDALKIVNQVYTLAEGRFELNLPDGSYCARSQAEGRPLGELVHFEVDGNAPPVVELTAKSRARVIVRVANTEGVPMPAKVTVVGTHEYRDDADYRDFLMDQVSGDPWRPTDLIPDEPDDPSTRRYIEDMAYGGADGVVEIAVRPGEYTVYTSRGVEYAAASRTFDLQPGDTRRWSVVLERQVDTTGYISGDFHMHAAGSIDSGLDYTTRLISIAGEGVESVISTEHNFVSDFEPWVYRNELHPWLKSVVGIELTTFEAGHFNSFPISRTLKSMNRGSFAWQNIPPGQIFSELRSMAPKGTENIVQVNHPRTPILGYFEQHNMSAFDGSITLPINEPGGGFSATTLASPNGSAFIEKTEKADGSVEYESTFSWDFDAIEIFNGPHLEELRHFRMPFDKTATVGSDDALPAEVLGGFRATFIEEVGEDNLSAELATYLTERDGEEVTEEDVDGFTMAKREEAIEDWVLSKIPPQWAILCDGNDVMKAGGLDDWYNLLNYYRPDGTYAKYTATGNSDSHGAHLDEPGLPRNFYFTGHDDPERVTEVQLVDALAAHHNVVSNGPFVDMTIDGKPIGSELKASGTVEVRVVVRAADWVGADRLRLVANGEVVRDLSANQGDDYWGWVPIELNDNGEFEATYQVPVDEDTWFVLEVESDQSMFPIASPQAIPPFNFSDVIGSLAGAFGFGAGVPGLSPDFTFPITGFAFTNPIWVIADGDNEFTPPQPPVYECREGEYVQAMPNALVAPGSLDELDNARLNAVKIPRLQKRRNPLARPKGENRDLRIIFEAWGGHAH